MLKKGDDFQRDGPNDEEPEHKLCLRFNSERKPMRDYKDAVAYLSLRNSGCPRKEAIMFAAKSNCRFDTTKSKDGPRGFRSLKLQNVPPHLKEEGWLYAQPDFHLGRFFPSRFDETLGEKEKRDKLEDNFNEQEVKMRQEYNQMITRMKEYVNNINQKYDFHTKSGDDLMETIKSTVQTMKKELDNRSYLMLQNVHLYQVAEVVLAKKQLTAAQKNNLIEKLNVFNNYENSPDFQNLPIFREEEDELIQITHAADAATNNNNQTLANTTTQAISNQQITSNGVLPQQSQQQQLEPNGSPLAPQIIVSQPVILSLPQGIHRNSMHNQTSREGVALKFNQITRKELNMIDDNIQYAHQLQNLEAATKLLEEFDRSEQEEVGLPMNRFDRNYELMRKQRQEHMRSMLEMVREDNQEGIEGQFNQQKYYFANAFTAKSDLPKEQREKEILSKFIVDTYCKPIEQQFVDALEMKKKQAQEEKKQQNLNQTNNNFYTPNGNAAHLKNSSMSKINYDTERTLDDEEEGDALDLRGIEALYEIRQSQLSSFRQKVAKNTTKHFLYSQQQQHRRSLPQFSATARSFNTPFKSSTLQKNKNQISQSEFKQQEGGLKMQSNSSQISKNKSNDLDQLESSNSLVHESSQRQLQQHQQAQSRSFVMGQGQQLYPKSSAQKETSLVCLDASKPKDLLQLTIQKSSRSVKFQSGSTLIAGAEDQLNNYSLPSINTTNTTLTQRQQLQLLNQEVLPASRISRIVQQPSTRSTSYLQTSNTLQVTSSKRLQQAQIPSQITLSPFGGQYTQTSQKESNIVKMNTSPTDSHYVSQNYFKPNVSARSKANLKPQELSKISNSMTANSINASLATTTEPSSKTQKSFGSGIPGALNY